MKKILINMMLPTIVSIVTEMITEDAAKKYIDKFFDLIEDYVADSKTALDDATVLPIIRAMRLALNVPDND